MNNLPIEVLNKIKAFGRKTHPLAIVMKESFAYEQYSKYCDQIETHTCFHKFYFVAYDLFTAYDMDDDYWKHQAFDLFTNYLHFLQSETTKSKTGVI